MFLANEARPSESERHHVDHITRDTLALLDRAEHRGGDGRESERGNREDQDPFGDRHTGMMLRAGCVAQAVPMGASDGGDTRVPVLAGGGPGSNRFIAAGGIGRPVGGA